MSHAVDTTGPTVLRAFSAMEDYELADFRAAFEAEHPGVSVTIERLSTRTLHDHLVGMGETDAWDVLLGMSVTSLVGSELAGLLAPLDDDLLSRLPPDASDATRLWFGPSGFAPAFCVAPDAVAARGAAVPASWEGLAGTDLGDGALCLPDPHVSGAAFLHVSALVAERGFDDAVDVLRRVAKRRPRVVESAFAPCLAVVGGEALVGATVATATRRLLREGHEVVSVTPSDAGRYELEAFGRNRHSRHPAEATALLRWMAGERAAAIAASYGKVVTAAAPGDHPAPSPSPGATPAGDAPAGDVVAPAPALVPLDATSAARDRDEVCAAWADAFGSRPRQGGPTTP